ncbi:MAG: hypothetical protein HWN69_06590 [Desulfobacterales bacterium]|nr:hypothetical protein [Desulfobacterales bacterium]
MRLLIFLFLFYLAYRLIKKLMLPGQPSAKMPEQEPLLPVDDVMVKDPYCETYFPKRDGIKKVIKGQTCYFCSTECRDEYLERIEQSERD